MNVLEICGYPKGKYRCGKKRKSGTKTSKETGRKFRGTKKKTKTKGGFDSAARGKGEGSDKIVGQKKGHE